MSWETVNHNAGIITLNQGTYIIDEVFCHIGSVLIDPVSGYQLFAVGDLMDIIHAGSGLIRIVRYTVNDNHLAAVAFICSLHCGAAYHKGLVDIHSGRQVGSASLKGAELYSAGLAAYLVVNQISQVRGRTGQLLVAECIYIIRTLPP